LVGLVRAQGGFLGEVGDAVQVHPAAPRVLSCRVMSTTQTTTEEQGQEWNEEPNIG